MSRFSRIVAAMAAVLLFAGVATFAGTSQAQDKPVKGAKAKPGEKKADKGDKADKADKADKKQATVSVKTSLGNTDKLIKAAEKAAGKAGHEDLREAAIQQLAARKALVAGKEKQALFLSLQARRIARGILSDTGGKIPKELAADLEVETGNTDDNGVEPYLLEARDEIPQAIDDHDDGMDEGFDDDLEDDLEDDTPVEIGDDY